MARGEKSGELGATDSPYYERSKLMIMTALASENDSLSFAELAERTQLTKGNLSSHLSKLESLGAVKVEKSFDGKKPLTTVSATKDGLKGFRAHLDTLQNLLELARGEKR